MIANSLLLVAESLKMPSIRADKAQSEQVQGMVITAFWNAKLLVAKIPEARTCCTLGMNLYPRQLLLNLAENTCVCDCTDTDAPQIEEDRHEHSSSQAARKVPGPQGSIVIST